MVKQQLQTELITAMKEKDVLKISTLRMLLSAIQYFEISKGKEYEASEQDIAQLISKEAKKRREAIELYKQGNRNDLAGKEESELEILKTYLPEQLSENDIRSIVEEVIKETNASSPQDMGKVMGMVMGKLKGKADGGLVNKIVQEELQK
jgi:hypothetical protein